MSKPRIHYSKTMSKYVCLDTDSEIRCAFGTGVTPEEAYWDYCECVARMGRINKIVRSYNITKTSLVGDKPKRWWEIWK